MISLSAFEDSPTFPVQAIDIGFEHAVKCSKHRFPVAE